MARKKLIVPRFKTEGEEAAWWWKHRAVAEGDFRAAVREGKTVSLQEVMVQARRVQARRKKSHQPVTIRMASEDIVTARQLADDRGIEYQTYIGRILHEALQKEAQRQPGMGD
jgi:predicted DNA binding CopG/RHH family protein